MFVCNEYLAVVVLYLAKPMHRCLYIVRELVPHVRITKLHCYCKHSVLCI